MIHGCQLSTRVVLYINTYGPFTKEGLDCRRMVYLFDKYQDIAPVTTKDINSELVEAANGTTAGKHLSRLDLADKLQLVKTGPLGTEVQFP